MLSQVSPTPFDAAAVLIVLSASFAFINARYLRIPQSVALTIMGAIGSFAVVGLDRVLPNSTIGHDFARFIVGIDFHQTLMNGMLSFLLFAGGLHVRWEDLKTARWPVLVLSTVGVVLSTALVGIATYVASELVGAPVPLIWCLVFGALISPTDPVAVMDVLKRAHVGPTLQATVAGESLFNDGIGVVVFSILLSAAASGQELSLQHAATLFVHEAVGGALLGLTTGYVAYRAMCSIDAYQTEVLISLALVMGGYAVSGWIGVSGPVAMAVAGVLIGNIGVANAMSSRTQDYLLKFWSLVDEVLNAILFLLIGLEVVTIHLALEPVLLGLIAVPMLLAARAVSVLLPLTALRPLLRLGPLAPPILIWGGLRGGISIALALGLPFSPERNVLLTATYMVVLFAVVVQGATIARLVAHVSRRRAGAESVQTSTSDANDI